MAITVLSQALVVGGGVVCAKWPAMAPVYGTLVGGVVTCLALFLGGNVTAGHLDAKNLVESYKAQAAHAEKDDASDDRRLLADRDDSDTIPPGPNMDPPQSVVAVAVVAGPPRPAEPRTF